jgi:chaperonin GroES
MKKINVGIVPLGDKVLIREIADSQTKTKSGIILPDSQDKDSKKGKVVAVGKGKYENGKVVPVGVKVGDEVIYSWGDKLTHEGVDYILVSESNISAIIN